MLLGEIQTSMLVFSKINNSSAMKNSDSSSCRSEEECADEAAPNPENMLTKMSASAARNATLPDIKPAVRKTMSHIVKKKKTKKPKDMPRRPLSAYNIFFREERARILARKGSDRKDPGVNKESLFSSLGKEVAKRWKDLNEQELVKYNEMAEKEMARYRTEMDEYQNVLARKNRLEHRFGANVAASVYLSDQTSAPLAAAAAIRNNQVDIEGRHLAVDPRREDVFNDFVASLSGIPSGMGDGYVNSLRNLNQSQNQVGMSTLAGMTDNTSLSSQILLHQLRQNELLNHLLRAPAPATRLGLRDPSTQELLQIQQLQELRRQELDRQSGAAQVFSLETASANQDSVDAYIRLLQRNQQQQTLDNLLGGLPLQGQHSLQSEQQRLKVLQLQQEEQLMVLARNRMLRASISSSSHQLGDYFDESNQSKKSDGGSDK